jgi:Ca2+:H+ antiporter
MPGHMHEKKGGGNRWVLMFTPAIAVAIILDLAGAGDVPIFIASALALIPPAAVMGQATEELAARAGPGLGGLLNVTFGNAPELIIAVLALHKGLHELVKASLIGSILGNVLLVLGLSMFLGPHPFRRAPAGRGRGEQRFDRTAASVQAGMLLLAVAALVMPAVLEMVSGARGLPVPGPVNYDFGGNSQDLTDIVSVVLIGTYIAGLIFSQVTHRDLFNPGHEPVSSADSVGKSVLKLAIAGALVGWMSELLVGSIEGASHSLGASDFFIGAVVVAIVGNAAEHWVAVVVARKDQMDLAINIAIGSAAQIALFVAPAVALISLLTGPHPMALVFNGYELAAVVIAVLIAGHVTSEGRSTWFEGLQLLAVYALIVVTFWLAPSTVMPLPH